MTADSLLPDPDEGAQRVALEIMSLDPGRRDEALAAASDLFAELAEAEGRSPDDAAGFALDMQRRIRDAIQAIEISGGGAGGRG